MRVAVLGTGRIGQLHARVLAGDERISELILADVDPERARSAAASTGARVADTIEDAIRAADAVVIAASTNAHADLVRSAVEQGRPTFCEKPLALDLESTRSLVEFVESRDGVVQVGFQRRFDPGYREARRLVEGGDLGTVYVIRLIAHDHEPPPDDYIPVSGGLFRDSSIHDFDALRWVTGAEVVEVYAVGAVRAFEVFAQNDDVDAAVATLKLSDGSLANLSQSRHDPRGYDIRMEIVGSRDSIVVGLSPRTPLHSVEPAADAFLSEPAWKTFLTRFETAYRNELGAFIAVASGDVPSPCTVRDGLEAMRIAVAATRSRTEHRAVALAEI